MAKFTTSKERRERFEQTQAEAKAVIEAEHAARLAKTAKLREARLAAEKDKKQNPK